MSSPAKRTLVLTVDYEIFGNGTGDVRQHVTEPTERMCRIAEKFGMPVTVFFEMEEYLLFQQHREALQRLLGYDPAAEMRRQAADLVRRGHARAPPQCGRHPRAGGRRRRCTWARTPSPCPV